MKKILLLAALIGSSAAAQPGSAPDLAAGPWDPPSRIQAQRKAMEALAFLDGVWRGEAQTEARPGKVTQTERAGPLLDGSIKLIEGRAYDEAGDTTFNAFAIISYDPVKRSYSMHSYAMGYAADLPFEVRPDGFSWTLSAGGGAPIRYTATIRDGVWHEVGERVAAGAAPVKTFEMRLRRVGPSAWPKEGAVPPR